MSDGANDAQCVQLWNELLDPWDLGRERGIPHVAARRLLVLAEQLDAGLVHEQVLGHGTLVLTRQARSLQMNAQQRRPVVRASLDDLAGLLHAPERLLRRIG